MKQSEDFSFSLQERAADPDSSPETGVTPGGKKKRRAASGECQSTAAALYPSRDKWVIVSITADVDPNSRLRHSD